VPEYADSFDHGTYADDQPVRLFRPDRYGPLDDDARSMPETLWHRLRLLGAAYGLHLLPLLDGTTDPVMLNSLQCEQLLSELRFVGSLVDDPLVRAEVAAVIDLVNRPSQGASKEPLAIEFP
jgi:hypothetical protein